MLTRTLRSRLRPLLSCHLTAQQRNCSSDGTDLADIKAQMAPVGGGSVDLSMDQATGVAMLCLNHPEKKNAVSGRMMAQLADAVSELERWPAGRGLLLYGSAAGGATFCSGGDLTTVRHILTPEGGARMSALMQDSLQRLSALPLISVAVVAGRALGGGAELTLAADFRLMTRQARLQFVQARMGVLTGWGGGARLAALAGPRAALELLTSCRPVSAAQALRLGLADALVPVGEEPLDFARHWLAPRIAHDLAVLHSVKRLVVAARGDLSGLWRRERELFAPLWGGDANLRALGSNLKH